MEDLVSQHNQNKGDDQWSLKLTEWRVSRQVRHTVVYRALAIVLHSEPMFILFGGTFTSHFFTGLANH